jgi:phosphoenolpyruvate carboxykinase (ATP)
MLTCDAFGVLPPVARLTPDQARYHFISGYTAKVAGTERGVTEPSATFSPCFGAPFMVLHPTAYARQLGEKMKRHGSSCWLVNTGWNGGPYGEGERIRIAHTRAIVSAIVDGHLDGVSFQKDPVFGIDVPATCPGVPSEILKPRDTWQDPAAYDDKAADLVRRFAEHFAAYEELAPDLKSVA